MFLHAGVLVICILALPSGIDLKLTEGDIQSPPMVTIPDGIIIGTYKITRNNRKIKAFEGIPFAKPPVGKLRFEPPKQNDPWEGDLKATSQPKPCKQFRDSVRSSEDCLYLNVYTPRINSTEKLPVFVFIYGGSFDIGSAEGFTHEYLLDEDIVYVVLQYRLGLFGFLSTGDAIVPGNMGLKDQRLGLRWVRDNIRFFGGDPAKVTIAGQSAGAVSVHYLMMFAADEGLFQAAISQSGTALCCWAFRPPAEIRNMVQLLSNLSGCPDDSVGFTNCLKAKSDLDILQLFDLKYKNIVYKSVAVLGSELLPLIGGVLEPACVEDRLVKGNPWDYKTNIPWLLGTNSKELLFIFSALINLRSEAGFILIDTLFNKFFPLACNYQNSAADGRMVPFAFREFYHQNRPIRRNTLREFINGFSDAFFNYPRHQAAIRNNQNKTYVYYFNYTGVNQFFPLLFPTDRVGVGHMDELFYFFEHPFGNIIRMDSEADTRLSRTLVKMWVNFATYHNPTPDNQPIEWTQFHINQSYCFINENAAGEAYFQMQGPFFPEEMYFWKSQPYPVRDDSYNDLPCMPEKGNQTSYSVTPINDFLAYLSLGNINLL